MSNAHVLALPTTEHGPTWPRPTAEPDLPSEVQEALAQALARALVKSIRGEAA